ncbi:MAG TPA: DUF5689 domain-containing protein [Saprospiraceae bacterium]|nr:DUF5689 domain-containing protein [Saprospiraceae bacterium]HMQ83378.1 DUF5689 domain-containing protein [Saprospiraceae bacterium]
MKWFSKLSLCLLGLSFVVTSCVDLEFDEPPVEGIDPNITANATIADLKNIYLPGQLTVIEEDLVVKGIVVADDRSGNFYRNFIFQDETAGIEILINLTDAYNFFPIGRELYIDCKGLVLGEYNGIIQLGGYIYTEDGGSQLGDIIDYNTRIARGQIVGEPEPKVKTINELRADDISTLVRLENVEFLCEEVNLPFSDPIGRTTLNRTLTDCDGNTIVLRSSGFADFAADLIPQGNGSVTGIYSVFGDTKQFYIRELEDVQLTEARCTEQNCGPTGAEEQISISSLRELFVNGASTAPDNKKIKGVVISDYTTANLNGQNLFLQDETAGIVVRFQSSHAFALGQEIEVIVSGQELSEFNGLIQVNGVGLNFAVPLGSGVLPTPREATVAEILANLENWESTLVKITGATITGSTTFAGATTVNDGTGSIDMFTQFSATFADEALPSGAVDMVAIVSQFNDPQVIIRNLSDVGGGGNSGGDPTQISIMELRQLFESGSVSGPVDRFIRGVVISDKDNANWHERNLVIQDATGGIVVRFDAAHSFAMGEEIEVNVSGEELSEFNGLLQVNNVPNTSGLSFGLGTLPNPRQATIAEIKANDEAWESTLVTIIDATFSDAGTFSGSKTLSDGTGEIVIFTRTQASFASSNVPTGPVSVTAIVSEFNEVQVNIRNLGDIEQ